MALVDCPICEKPVKDSHINGHIDSGCASFVADASAQDAHVQSASNGSSSSSTSTSTAATAAAAATATPSAPKRSASDFFATPVAKRSLTDKRPIAPIVVQPAPALAGKKRNYEEGPGGAKQEDGEAAARTGANKAVEEPPCEAGEGRAPKKIKTLRAAPLAERMRPTTLDDVCGQDLVGPHGVLRSLVEAGRVPSMILWGAAGTGKTTIARCIAGAVGGRFVELNATSTGVAECKRLFAEAANELALGGRRTIIFCDEMHRFSRAQQDVFLRPVEAGTITLVGATTENPSFRIVGALLSRCRTFTLRPLGPDAVVAILRRARDAERAARPELVLEPGSGSDSKPPEDLLDDDMLAHLARFSDGDARTALNLLELALSLASRPGTSRAAMTQALTKTLVYDRAGDQHYDTISAFHKSVRGSDPDAALYYLARMLQSGEDPLFVARRMVVIASEDVGLADNSLLPLATAAYTAAQQIGMPEARIPLAHCAVALCLAPKSTRAYRALNNAFAALKEPGVAALPVPLHLRNAPTRMMRDMGYGAEYKYPPNYKDGKVKQAYLPEELGDRRFLEARDLGTEVDPEYELDRDA